MTGATTAMDRLFSVLTEEWETQAALRTRAGVGKARARLVLRALAVAGFAEEQTHDLCGNWRSAYLYRRRPR